MDERRPDPTQDTWSGWLPDLDLPDGTPAPVRTAATTGAASAPGPSIPPPAPLPAPENRVAPVPYAATPIPEWVGPRRGQAPPPPTRLGWAILCTLFCFTPFGIVAIIKSTQVNPTWATGNWDGARAASRSVKRWCLLAAAVWPGSILLLGCMGAMNGGHLSFHL